MRCTDSQSTPRHESDKQIDNLVHVAGTRTGAPAERTHAIPPGVSVNKPKESTEPAQAVE